ncbi:MAG: fused MFS/spermidine synthase [Burkholderiales bacterium]|jgi:spermidine synthase|nr:fused MFS/spermidine synthase [Burkholderiales bacterium]
MPAFILFTLIFISGGAILALELLSSRIMTPYFGVSLYIWTGILSITLVSLALGYWWGGRLAGNAGVAPARRLGLLFAIMPALAGLAIIAACAIYPFVFHPLARWSLSGGAFAACMILLFLPLVATSAMNPLLVALLLQQQEKRKGDAGSGLVFFVSTLGSVVGVIITAFGLIPYISNYTATLMVALLLGLLSLVAASSKLVMAGRGTVTACAIAAMSCAALLAWQGDRYTGRQGPVAFSGAQWQVEGIHSSLFGTVKILRSAADADGKFLRMYFHDGLIQNTVDSNQRSISFYTWALEALARAYQPQMQDVLMLGLGAGIVPSRLDRAGARVEVVEIDPSSLAVARQYFGFDPKRVTTHQADARTFVGNCTPRHDVVLVDLFHGDGTPDYLITREFFRDLKSCLKPGGVAIFNTFANLDDTRSYSHLLATLQSELPHVALYRPDWPGMRQINSFLVASPTPLPAPQRVTISDVPEHHAAALWDMLAKPQAVGAAMTASGKIIHDAWNAAALDMAAGQAAFRQGVLDAAPPALLMN